MFGAEIYTQLLRQKYNKRGKYDFFKNLKPPRFSRKGQKEILTGTSLFHHSEKSDGVSAQSDEN